MPTIIIIGAGLAGVATALRFRQNGFTCKVFERSTSPRTIGGAINIAPNGHRLLARLGVHETVIASGCAVRQFDIRNDRGVNLGAFPNYSSDGFVGVRIMRSELLRILLDEATTQGVEVEYGRGVEVVWEEERELGRKAVFVRFSDGTVVDDADLLVGSDGIHSVVRKYVCESEEKVPVYTGSSIVYGIIDTKVLDAETIATMPATTGVFGTRCFFACAFCKKDRSQLYWVSTKIKGADEKLDDPAVIRSQELEKFANFYAPIPDIVKHTTKFFSWPVYELPVLDHWYKGKVVLVGDAAHALPPDKGQGLSQALEDVFVLARVVEQEGDLARYEAARKPRVEKLRGQMRRESDNRNMGPLGSWFRDWIMWAVLMVGHFVGNPWAGELFGYDPDTVKI